MLEYVPDAQKIRQMKETELQALAGEIRTFLVDKVSEKGGHLASNLGAVELTLALYAVFDPEKDRLIFDVGHQAYTHKILSGRKDDFDTLRELNGLSGFPKSRESVYDAFDTGHSSTSISAGLGMAQARDLMHENYSVVSIIGDGSMTGGMAYEALNNASQLKSNFIIILNDNDMSISENVGGVRKYLTGIRAGKGYNRVKAEVRSSLSGIPKIGHNLVEHISNTKDSVKELLVPGGMFFENIGITYLGPVDGHNITEMKNILMRAKELDRCVLIHVRTQKGRGYKPAEEHPDVFHGIGPFDKETGEPLGKKGKTYSQVFGSFLAEAAKTDETVCGITAAMSQNLGMQPFETEFPKRFFDVGIAEQHAVTFAAGLAKSGMHPYFAVFSSFLQRGYDQIVHDVCMQDLPVTFAVDRAGIVGHDGETHQGAFDLAYLMPIPNITVMAPKNARELQEMLEFSLKFTHPCAIRYPRGAAYEGLSMYQAPVEYGKAEMLKPGSDVVLLALGSMVETAAEADAQLLSHGIHATVVNMRFAKPWDQELVKELMQTHPLIVTMEDGSIEGGFGSSVARFAAENGFPCKVKCVGIPECFVPQGSTKELKELLKMDAASITDMIVKEVKG